MCTVWVRSHRILEHAIESVMTEADEWLPGMRGGGRRDEEGTESRAGTVWRGYEPSASCLWGWLRGFTHLWKLTKLYTLNGCSLLGISYTPGWVFF